MNLNIPVLLVVGVPYFALVFLLLTLVLGKVFDSFGREGSGGLVRFYFQFLLLSAIYMGCYIWLRKTGYHPLLGLFLVMVGYRFVFRGAGWLQALVTVFLGGIIGWYTFELLLPYLGMRSPV